MLWVNYFHSLCEKQAAHLLTVLLNIFLKKNSAFWRRVALVNRTDVSEERVGSIFMVEKPASVEQA
jgi:hypothetical protein